MGLHEPIEATLMRVLSLHFGLDECFFSFYFVNEFATQFCKGLKLASDIFQLVTGSTKLGLLGVGK